ncbi:MAG TPA: Uma2 family endonuclease, partial [Myxococcus sp.]|nr:Uma2 family endonuclease [Myxococcus sp.]
VGGDRRKDTEENVSRYAGLGIPEYFIYDRARQKLIGHRLNSPGARIYSPIVPQHGRYASNQLGLELQLEDGRLRFYAGTALLLESEELISRLERMVDVLQQRADEEAQLRQEETRLRQEEARLREEAEQRVKELQAELERLKRQR